MLDGILNADSVVKLTVSKVSTMRGRDRKPTGWFARKICIHTAEGDDLTIHLSSMEKGALAIKREESIKHEDAPADWLQPKVYNPDYKDDPEGDPGDALDD